MQFFIAVIKSYFDNERGATAMEYGLMVAFIGVAIIVGLEAIGTNMATAFNAASADLLNAGIGE